MNTRIKGILKAIDENLDIGKWVILTDPATKHQRFGMLYYVDVHTRAVTVQLGSSGPFCDASLSDVRIATPEEVEQFFNR